MLHKVKVAAAVAVAALVGYVLANVLIPEPGPITQMAKEAAEHCGVEVEADTANRNVLDRIPEPHRGLDWYWYGTRFEAEGGYVAVYELENRATGDDGLRTEVYCPDQTKGWIKRG